MPYPSRVTHFIDSDDELDDEVCFGLYRGDVVGIRYYRGTVNNGEMVSLNREPHNPYDCNAVRVNNVYGVQVGHIKRALAKALADVMDNRLVRLEGVVPFGQNNMFHMPCDISFWGKPEHEQVVIQKMRHHGFTLKSTRQPLPPPSKGSGPAPSQPSGYARNSGYSAPAAAKITQHRMQNELDKMFEKMEALKDKTVLRDACEAIKTKLYPHQKQALAWMIARETCDDLPPFWSEKNRNGKKEYFNSATNFTSANKPSSIRGGILADDMGLGKTLEVIALIITNFHKGRPIVTLKDTGTGKSKTLKQKVRRPLKSTSQKSRPRKKAVVISDDESEDEEMPPLDSDDGDDDVEDDDDEDDDADVNVDELAVMTGKSDPDFKPVVSVAVEDSNIRRSSRTRQKPARYVEVNSSDEDDEEAVELAPSPPKKQKKKAEKKPAAKRGAKAASAAAKRTATATNSKPENTSDEAPALPSLPTEIKEPDSAITPPSTPKHAATTSQQPSTTGGAVSSAAPDIIQITGSPSFCRKELANLGPRPTLVVCPLSVLSNWENQFELHVHPNLLNIYTYYGQDRTKDTKVLEDQDVVLTTYQTLSSEFSKGKSPLMKVQWLRVVLDEGHSIRNPNALMTKAAHALNAERRWIVTGTPIQNSMKDLWSIICFLRLEPFMDRQWWKITMERPVTEGDQSALQRLQSLMHCIAMRRTKTQKVDGRPLVELPDRQVFVQPIELSLEERKLYDVMAKEGRLVIGKYFRAGTLLNNYADVLAILMRLRQLCCHPKLCAKACSSAAASCKGGTPDELRQRLIASLMSILATGVDEECSVCLDSLVTPVITHCAHVFCRPCIENVIRIVDKHNPRCPLCRSCINCEQLVEVPPQEDVDEVDTGEWQSSSKVDALMAELIKLRASDPSVKSVVISQFTSMLSVVETPLIAEGFSFLRLDGSMSQARRAQVIESFDDRSANSASVLLLSMKAGGVGLNLTAASRVFLLDPAWNPAAEDQCFDRCHRLGQTRDVIITKFITKDSVEERMLELQEKKRELMTEAFKKTTADKRREQRINDLKALMDF